MKERLQKDLRFINKWFIRLIISLVLGLVLLAIIKPDINEVLGITASTGIVFLLLYLLSAWLYPPGDNG